MKLETIKNAIEELSDSEKREFFSEVIPEIGDKSLTKEIRHKISEREQWASRYLESLDELNQSQEK